MDDLLRRALGKSIQIDINVAAGLWTTLVDPHQLENVILNLAINARDAMEGDGLLTLELDNATLDYSHVANEPDVIVGQYVLLEVSDTGCGMAPDVLARAFEPFFTTKREGEGTGLGLSMAYGFVKQSNGHIRAYSEVGSGTTFKIYLPRSRQPEVEVISNHSANVVGGTETILVVEDDPVVQTTVVDMLHGLGYRVLRADNGQSALNVLQSGIPVDLLFTDVVMAGPVRSVELARQAREMFPEMVILFTSGYTKNAIVHGGRLDPGVELISKPYRREALARKIRQLIGDKKPKAPLLPASAAPTSLVLPSTGVLPQALNSMRILVVEDNEDARTALCELLGLLGHTVDQVGSAEEAFELLGQKSFDILLTDVTLPGMSGLELARQAIHANYNFKKIIFSSGYGAKLIDEFEFEATTLPKPYNLSSLQKALLRVA